MRRKTGVEDVGRRWASEPVERDGKKDEQEKGIGCAARI